MSKVYIDLDLLMEKARGTDAYFAIKSIVTGIPAADVVEVKHGEWIVDGYITECSNCHEEYVTAKGMLQLKEYERCPNCGAKMDGKTLLMQDCIDLINRQKAEIERLTFENLQMIASIKRLKSEAYKEFTDKVIKKICETVSAPTPTESRIVEKCNDAIYSILSVLTKQRKEDEGK